MYSPRPRVRGHEAGPLHLHHQRLGRLRLRGVGAAERVHGGGEGFGAEGEAAVLHFLLSIVKKCRLAAGKIIFGLWWWGSGRSHAFHIGMSIMCACIQKFVPAADPRPRRAGPARRRPGSGGRTPPGGRAGRSGHGYVCIYVHIGCVNGPLVLVMYIYTHKYSRRGSGKTRAISSYIVHTYILKVYTSASRAAISARLFPTSTRASTSSFDPACPSSNSERASSSCVIHPCEEGRRSCEQRPNNSHPLRHNVA